MTAPPRKAIRRMSEKKLKALGGKAWSTISKRSESPRKVNPVAKARRTARYRKMLAGKEYKVARDEAFVRADYRCEFINGVTVTWTGGPESGQLYEQRCFEMLNLHAHHLRYPKARPLRASDLKILCRFHHEQVECEKMHKTRMF